MGEINPAPEGVGGFAKIEHHQPRAGFGNAVHFIQAFFPTRQVPQTVTDGHNIERGVRKRKLQRVARHKNRISGLGFRVSDFVPGFSDFQHRRAEIQSGDIRAAPRERQRKVAGATAQIERAIPGLNGGEFDDAAFPAPVQTEALHVVEQIVAPRDGGEKVVDLCGALFARCAENVAHAAKFSTRTDGKVKNALYCFAEEEGVW